MDTQAQGTRTMVDNGIERSVTTAAPGLPARMTAAAAEMIDRISLPIYGLVIACFATLFALATRLLSMEADEAWILLSTDYVFGVPAPVTNVLGSPTVTTGGPHLLVHGVLGWITSDLLAHRAVTLVAAAGLLLLVYRALRRADTPVGRAVAGTALFAAVPGFVLQAGMAMGEVFAAAFLVWAAIHWVRRGAGSMPAAIIAGVLLGLACAARVSCAAAIPALVIYVLFTRFSDRRMLSRAVAAALIAAIIMGLMVAIYFHLGSMAAAGTPHPYLATASATGLSKPKSLGRMLQSIEIGAWFLARDKAQVGSQPGARSAQSYDLAGVLLFMGLAQLAAWVVVAPIPHLRYLWPAMACIWLSGIILLLDLWHRARTPVARLALHGIVVTGCGYALIVGALTLVHGESLTLVYQAMGVSPRLPISGERRFRAAADQRALAAFVASRPASARFFAITPPVAYPIAYLGGRNVEPAIAMAGGGERYMLILPADYTVWRPGPGFDAWRRTHARPAFQSGGVAAFRIAEDAPAPPIRQYPVGENDLF